MTTTHLMRPIHVMPVDQVRAQATMAAGQRLLEVGALISRLLTAGKGR